MYWVLLSFKYLAATEIVFGVRELASHTDSDSESKSGNSSDGDSCGAQPKDQKLKEQSQRHGNLFSHSCFSLFCTWNIVYSLDMLLWCLWKQQNPEILATIL